MSDDKPMNAMYGQKVKLDLDKLRSKNKKEVVADEPAEEPVVETTENVVEEVAAEEVEEVVAEESAEEPV
uniref:hypothetical protein n=1 Tax=Methanobrevibacter sp. TaxID=66852 RepID=UPI0038654A6E